MFRWQGLDEHDLQPEEEAEAQRREYVQRLKKVETQKPLVCHTLSLRSWWPRG